MEKRKLCCVVFLSCVLQTVSSSQTPDCATPLSDNIAQFNVSKDCSPRDTCPGGSIPAVRIVESDWVQFQERNCFCDSECSTYGDCCQQEPRRQRRQRIIPARTFQCMIIQGIFSSGLPIYVVDRCPDTWADDVIRGYCESEAGGESAGLIVRWFVSDDDWVLYKNLYCAWCHSKTNVTFWKARVACNRVVHLDGDLQSSDFGDNLRQRIQDGACHIKYDVPDGADKKRFVRMCKPTVDTCPASFHDKCVRVLCEGPNSTSSYVYSSQTRRAYRNIHCAKCNNEYNVSCNDTISADLYMPVFGMSTDMTPYPLNIIFDLNPGNGPVAEYRIGTESGELINNTISELKACPDQHVYDPFVGQCRFVVCRTGYTFDRRGCTRNQRSNYNGTADECGLVALNRTEFVLLDNGSLYVNSSDALYDLTSYELTEDDRVLVCMNLTQNYTDVHVVETPSVVVKFSYAQGIVSVVGQCLSVVALSVHIAVYAIFPKLRNLAGKCLLCLATSLLAAQLLFLLGVSTSSIDPEQEFYACAAVGVLTHLAFLCSFTWMNVMALDVCRTFSGSVHKTSPGSLQRRFYKYSVYAWGAPVVVVSVAIGLDTTTAAVRPSYGRQLCWFNDRRALFVYFALPVALILATNLALFVTTAVRIFKVQRMSQTVTKSADSQRYGLYVKLFVIMGLTWIFAFIATATDSEVLWYFFLILNSLQGLFICVSFVFTKQVLSLARELRTELVHSLGHSDESGAVEQRTTSTLLGNRRTLTTSSQSLAMIHRHP